MANGVTFDGGIKLLGVDALEVGFREEARRTSIKTKLVEPLEFDVPPNTKFVHVSFRTVDMCFGKMTNRQARRVKSVYFEITNQNYDDLANGKFKCDLYAHFESGESDDDWAPYFIVEGLFFG